MSGLSHPRPSSLFSLRSVKIFLLFVCLQITEALSFLHYSGHVLHRNVCPSSILVTKKGTWKLGGLEFTGKPYTLADFPLDTEFRHLTRVLQPRGPVSKPRWFRLLTCGTRRQTTLVPSGTGKVDTCGLHVERNVCANTGWARLD
jgi:serine/threonine protein kinase